MRPNWCSKFISSAIVIVVITDIHRSEAREFRNLMKSHVNAIVGLFPTSKDVIVNEIVRRTSQDECFDGSDFSFTENFKADANLSSSEHVISIGFVEYDVSDNIPCHLTENLAVNEKYIWMFVPFINAHDNVPRLFSYACFTDSDKQVPLPFFGDNIYRVESIEVNEGVLTVRNGSDEMVIRMTFDPDCDPAPDTTDEEWHNVRESPFFPLSGPFSDQICDTLGPDINFCKVAKENSCEISRAQQDFCIRLDNVGPSKRCDATIEITEMTGIFREKSLLLSQTPVRAMESEWIRGNRSLAMITPCFK